MKTTKWQMIRFSAGITGYRIVRQSMELFLIPWFKSLGYSVGLAGNVFFAYSFASILTGVFFLYSPTPCFGTYRRASTYFLLTVGLTCAGFAAILNVTSLWAIYISAIMTGVGTTGWNLNFQTMSAVSFSEDDMGEIAQFRQIFEVIGFLVPSISLAVLANIDIPLKAEFGDASGSAFVIPAASIILAILLLLFHLLSSDQIIHAAVNMPSKELMGNQKAWDDIRDAFKNFFTTYIVPYFLLTSILLATSNLMIADMSIITTEYIGLCNVESLWIGSLGLPLGAILSILFQMLFQKNTNKKDLALQGITYLILFLAVLICISPLLPAPTITVSQILLFFVGFGTGFLYSPTYASSLTLWLTKLKSYPVAFNSRAAVINNIGVQGIIAIIFQVQTLIIQFTIESGTPTTIKAGMVCFLPIIFILLAALAVSSRFSPYPKDAKFGWPDRNVFNFFRNRFLLSVVDTFTPLQKKDVAFSFFQVHRLNWFGAHLTKSRVKRGPSLETTATLKPKDFKKFLTDFDELATNDEWWFSEAKLDSILLDGNVALQRRLELLSEACSAINITTWCFEESKVGNKIADLLISKARAGLEVNVIVDEVTLYYFDQESKLGIEGLPMKMAILQKLVYGGVHVRMLSKWYKNKRPEYVIGTHRKIMLVDGKWLLTGGRNINDKYFTTDNFHYIDSEVVLQGNFEDLTASFFKTTLWNHAVDIDHLFPRKPMVVNNSSVLSCYVPSYFKRSKSKEIPNDPDNCDVSVFQLDHKAGDPKGHDIIFSSLLFMIDTAKESIDLIYGYFQLFEELDAALTRAAQRGVRLRLITNSGETNGLSYLNDTFRPARERLLALGAEIYVPSMTVDVETGVNKVCHHHKMAIADSRAALIGSWNCIGTSVFYDSEFNVFVFDETTDSEDTIKSSNSPGHHTVAPVQQLVEDSIQDGRLVPVTEISGFDVPGFYTLASRFQPKMGSRDVMRRGF